MNIERIVLGGGCFWCIESVFRKIIGVQSVFSGYAGGHDPNPTYERVCSGVTGHTEVVELVFDNSAISLDTLLRIFFTIHDPTTLNRQGHDIGSQYRSAIYYSDVQQKDVAQRVMDELTHQGVFRNKIVTQLEPLVTFHAAEDYHQNFFEKNPGNSYCQFSIPAKQKKVLENFADFLK